LLESGDVVTGENGVIELLFEFCDGGGEEGVMGVCEVLGDFGVEMVCALTEREEGGDW